MTGDKVRDTTFLRVPWGYDMAKVDDLLGRVAAELDAGRPAGPLCRECHIPIPETDIRARAADIRV